MKYQKELGSSGKSTFLGIRGLELALRVLIAGLNPFVEHKNRKSLIGLPHKVYEQNNVKEVDLIPH